MGSPRNAIHDRVTALEPNGTLVRVCGTGRPATDITPAGTVELELRTGAEVWFVVKAAEVTIYPTHVYPPAEGGDLEDVREPADR